MPFEVSFHLGLLPIVLHGPFGLLLLENMFEAVLACQREGFFTVPYELIAEFSAEITVRTKVGVPVCPVIAILPDAVVCCLQEEPDSLIYIPVRISSLADCS